MFRHGIPAPIDLLLEDLVCLWTFVSVDNEDRLFTDVGLVYAYAMAIQQLRKEEPEFRSELDFWGETDVQPGELRGLLRDVAFSERAADHACVLGLVRNQLDRASTSVPLNIAEGNGKFTSADRCRFFDNARGSALECAACLDVMVAKQFVEPNDVQQGKTMLVKIVSMLFGLIRANSDVRVFEESPTYAIKKE